MFDLEALKNDVAEAQKRSTNDRNVSRAIPDGWGRVVVFNRDGGVVGRMNQPLEQSLAKFQQLIRGEVPDGYGYALLYAHDRPTTRIGYHTYKGVCQLDLDHIAALVSPNADKKTRSTKRGKPAPAVVADTTSEAEPF